MQRNFPSNKFNLSQLRANVSKFLAKSSGPDLRAKRRIGREHFIPVCPTELIESLAQRGELSPADQEVFCRLGDRIETIFHNEFRVRLQQLEQIYSCVNPDLDTESLSPTSISELDREIAVDELFTQFMRLLERANFRQLSREEVANAIGKASALGVRLDVDLDQFEQLAVFARGEIAVKVPRREWRDWWYRQVELDVPMFQRLVVIFRMRPSHEETSEPVKAAYIRLFKNVPQQDIDMVLPGGKVHISLFDRGKILVPTISGIGLATFKLGLLFFAGIYGLLKIGGLIGGAIGSGWKSVNGYWKTKNKYELSLTKHLYYQNLDNNAGVLLRLVNEAERQELRETIVGYYALLTAERPCSMEELAERAERILDACGVEVCFEVTDGLAKMLRLGLCEPVEARRWKAVALTDATQCVIQRNLRDALRV